MPTNKTIALAAVVVTAVGLASCAQKESYSSLPPSGDSSADGPKVVEATPRVQRVEEADSGSDARRDGENILNERLVYFDFDKSEIRPEFRAMLSAHTDYLVSNRGSGVMLQGHADERGSTEYNLALGQRRADAVREYMIAGGVYADQLEAISYGEERPRALGSNEAAWAENRRVEILYTDE